MKSQGAEESGKLAGSCSAQADYVSVATIMEETAGSHGFIFTLPYYITLPSNTQKLAHTPMLLIFHSVEQCQSTGSEITRYTGKFQSCHQTRTSTMMQNPKPDLMFVFTSKERDWKQLVSFGWRKTRNSQSQQYPYISQVTCFVVKSHRSQMLKCLTSKQN